MKIVDILEETYFALSANKSRSFLTVLGIVIGISSVIAMLAIGQGAQSSIETSIESAGSNMLMISPGAQREPGTSVSAGRGSSRTLTLEDADAIKNSIDSIKAVSPEASSRYQVVAKGQNTNTQIYGVMPDYSIVRSLEVEDGNFITSQNITSMSKVAVIGPGVRDDSFGEESSVVGQTIRINKIDFKIIGVSKSKGGSGFNNMDDMIFIPLSTMQRFLTGNEYLNSISVSASSADTTSIVQSDVTVLLLERHNISDISLADFSIFNQADIAETASSVAKTFTMLLGCVASISLLVGGIGIMNMMLTNVTERTREIGLRKAIGAKRRDISNQFLIESVVLTFIGGFVGIILGFLISYGASYFNLIQTKMTLFSVLLAVVVSATIGIVFGYYPASRAAKLNPIEALRYE